MASIKDVAREAGVSIGTVDRILHQRGRFSAETAKRVQQAMKRLDYQPNYHARGLRNQAAGIFYALLPGAEQDSGYWGLIRDGVEGAARTLSSYGCSVEVLHFDRYRRGDFSRALLQAEKSQCSGLLIAPVSCDPVETLLENIDIPFALIDTDIAGSGRLSYLGDDSLQSGRLAARMLNLIMREDSEPLVWTVFPAGGGSHLSQRMKGFSEYSSQTCLHWNLKELLLQSDREEDFHRLMNDEMDRNGRLPQGIFVANSLIYHAASWLEEQGLNPAGIALVGYDLIPGKEDYLRRGVIDFILTQQPEEQGRQGMLMLYRNLVLKRDIPEEWIAPLNLITRENCYSFEKPMMNEIG